MNFKRKIYRYEHCSRIVVEIFPNFNKNKTDLFCMCGSEGIMPYKMLQVDGIIGDTDELIIAEIYGKIQKGSLGKENEKDKKLD